MKCSADDPTAKRSLSSNTCQHYIGIKVFTLTKSIPLAFVILTLQQFRTVCRLRYSRKPVVRNGAKIRKKSTRRMPEIENSQNCHLRLKSCSQRRQMYDENGKRCESAKRLLRDEARQLFTSRTDYRYNKGEIARNKSKNLKYSSEGFELHHQKSWFLSSKKYALG